MNIAVIGTGAVGKTFAEIWATRGHTVVFGTREPQSEKARLFRASVGKKASVVSVKEAVANAEIVLLAVPWANALETLKSAGRLAGKIVIDPINSFTPELQLSVGQGTSVAEEIAKAAPGAKVIKAFNTLGVAQHRVQALAPMTDGVPRDDLHDVELRLKAFARNHERDEQGRDPC